MDLTVQGGCKVQKTGLILKVAECEEQRWKQVKKKVQRIFVVIHTWDVCHTWWGGIHRQEASWTAAQRWAVSALPAGRWRRTESSTSSRPLPCCEHSPPAFLFRDSLAFCQSICRRIKPQWEQKRTKTMVKDALSQTTKSWYLLLFFAAICVGYHGRSNGFFCSICSAYVLNQIQKVMATTIQKTQRRCLYTSHVPANKLFSLCVWSSKYDYN